MKKEIKDYLLNLLIIKNTELTKKDTQIINYILKAEKELNDKDNILTDSRYYFLKSFIEKKEKESKAINEEIKKIEEIEKELINL